MRLWPFKNKAPVSYAPSRSLARVGLPAVGNPEAYMRAMGSVGTLFAIVHRTSNATSQVDWRLFRTADGRGRLAGGEDRREVTGHPAADLWNKPNPFMTQQEFVEVIQQHIDLTGEGWVVVSRADGFDIPLELWPVRPDRMEPVPHPTEFLSGYIYKGPNGERIPLGLDEVIMMRMPHPCDPYRGMGPVQALLADLDSVRYGAEYNRNFFINGAEPGGIIEVEEHLSDDDFKEMTTRWREQHQGVNNAHRVAVIEQGKWVQNLQTMRDMQFVQLREVSREIIREAFNFPKPLLGTVDDVNRANAEAAEVTFARWLLVPRLERIKAALNHKLLPMFGTTGEGVEFAYDNPVPENAEQINAERASKVDAAVKLIGAGFDPDDVLELVGLPSMDFVGKPDAPETAPTTMEPDMAALAKTNGNGAKADARVG